MNRPLPQEELQALQKQFPVTEEAPAKLTRQQKLTMWADLVEGSTVHCGLYSNLEHWSQGLRNSLDCTDNFSAFGIAVNHEPFRVDGLKGTTVGDIERYFELSLAELHEFSCDCGGHISNKNQAERIRNISNRPQSGIMSGVATAFSNIFG